MVHPLQQRHVLQQAVKPLGSDDLHTRATFFWHFSQFTRVAHGNGEALKAEVQSKFHKKAGTVATSLEKKTVYQEIKKKRIFNIEVSDTKKQTLFQ